jgi:hypothetical protein
MTNDLLKEKITPRLMGIMVSGITLLIIVGFIYQAIEFVRQDYSETRWYEKRGLYTPKLTIEQWNHRMQTWTPDQVHELLGTPIEETTHHPEVEFFWKYRLPLRSSYEASIVTDKIIYVWFLKPEGRNTFNSVGIVEQIPD